jgi:hypothetical protein
MDANCNSFHLRVFLNLSISCDNFGERKAKFNLDMSRTTQKQLYRCIHVP